MLPVADPAVQRGTTVSGLARLPVLISMQISSVCEVVPGLGSVNEYWSLTNPIITTSFGMKQKSIMFLNLITIILTVIVCYGDSCTRWVYGDSC